MPPVGTKLIREGLFCGSSTNLMFRDTQQRFTDSYRQWRFFISFYDCPQGLSKKDFVFHLRRDQGEARIGPHLFPKAINGYWKMLKFTQALGVFGRMDSKILSHALVAF